MSDTPIAAPAVTPDSQPSASPDVPPRNPKEIAKEQFKKETAELVARDKAEREVNGRFKKPEPRPAQDAPSDSSEPPKDLTAAERKIWKLKVDGQEVDFDATDEEAVRRAVQKAHAADKRMNEAAMTRKQAEQFIDLLKTNPRAVLEHPGLGIDIKNLAEQVIWENLQQSAKSPQEREREVERQELEQYRREKAQREAATKQAEREALKEKYRQDWSQKFEQTLDTAGLPKSDWTLTRMATYMREALARGHKHVQPSDVVDMVREDWSNHLRETYGRLDGEKLIQTLGEDVVKKIRETELRKFQDGVRHPPARRQPDTGNTSGPKYGSTEEMLRATGRK